MAKRNTSGIKAHEFKKGKSGNPNGRPKKLPALDTLLPEVLGDESDSDSEIKQLLESLLKEAKQGKGSNKVRAAEILLDRAYGKAKQSIDHTTKGESINPNPIKFVD